MLSHLQTILLLVASNTFMTCAWYGHLKYLHDRPLWMVILIAWGIAFFEYCFQVPANRIGFTVLDGYQLKIFQEIITLVVFVVFAQAGPGRRHASGTIWSALPSSPGRPGLPLPIKST